MLVLFLAAAAVPFASARNAFDLYPEISYGRSSTVVVKNPPGAGRVDAKLTYLTLRGLAELPVFCLEFAGMPYLAAYLSRDEMRSHKHKFPLGRVPFLELDGAKIAQSASIVRHIAALTGLSPEEHDLRAATDMMFETVNELFGEKWFNSTALDAQHKSKDGFEDLSGITRFGAITNGGIVASSGAETTSLEKTLAVLATFEDFIASADETNLVGKHLTYADLALFLKLEAKVMLPLKLEVDMLGKELPFPMLATFYAAIKNLPRVTDYMRSGRRMPRVEKRDGDYYYIDPPNGLHQSDL